MNREEIQGILNDIPNPYVLVELPTGYGKSKLALDRMSKMNFQNRKDILIVVPRLVLIDNWINEFKKWGYEGYLRNIKFVTYVSFPKYSGEYHLVIFDEAHHLSQRCIEALPCYKIDNAILLSATVGRDMKDTLKRCFPNLYICKVSIRNAIQDSVLPDPRVYLVPLVLDNTKVCCEIVKNPKCKKEIRVPYYQRFKYSKIKDTKIIIECTQRQYYDDVSSLISWYKNKMVRNPVFKNIFLMKSGERLKWLSWQKNAFVSNLLNTLQDQRTLTFCSNIRQTALLGTHCINSENPHSAEYLEDFNNGVIDHITSCNMLDEGVNLTNCRIGIYASLNSSDRLIVQKLGRLLRHPDPVLVIPYFKGTRDEEIVEKMLKDYNPELVTIVTDLNQLIL